MVKECLLLSKSIKGNTFYCHSDLDVFCKYNLREMKIISMNRLALSTFATCLLLASKTICVDESIMASLQSREEYSDDTYSEVRF